jgi:hypothetical protein
MERLSFGSGVLMDIMNAAYSRGHTYLKKGQKYMSPSGGSPAGSCSMVTPGQFRRLVIHSNPVGRSGMKYSKTEHLICNDYKWAEWWATQKKGWSCVHGYKGFVRHQSSGPVIIKVITEDGANELPSGTIAWDAGMMSYAKCQELENKGIKLRS